MGVGSGSGTMIGGLLIGRIGIRTAYRLFAAFLALVVFLFLACQWQGRNPDKDGDEDSRSNYRAVPSQVEDADEE